MEPITLATSDALLIIDVQNDFLPGGTLAVTAGDQVIAPLNRCIAAFTARDLPIFASRDWHPPDHCSFQAQGGPWPNHCIAGTHGAEFAAMLDISAQVTVISKATASARDAYSAFDGTDLDRQLRRRGVARLFVGGLATDYCVVSSVMDALRLDYRVMLIKDAIRAVNVKPEDGANAMQRMRDAGVAIVASRDIAP